jgi:hypothetical protein
MAPGMGLNDLHAPVYVSTGNEICHTVAGGSFLKLPLYLSVMTGAELGKSLKFAYELHSTNVLGESTQSLSGHQIFDYQPWMQTQLDSLLLFLPQEAGLATLRLRVEDENGKVLHRNFVNLEIQSETLPPDVQVIEVAPADFSKAEWSQKQWSVREGRKVNGAGKGFFEYTFPVPANATAKQAYVLLEASAKELFVKDQDQANFDQDQDYMKGSRVAPSSNPNSYPMTDETLFPSRMVVSTNGKELLRTTLADDPADHRGVLSWHHQLQDRKLSEAGSYGYLIKVPISRRQLRQATQDGTLRLRIAADAGLAIYGKEFGRYPINPSLVLEQ